ncbi:MAG: DPP IV N-terminal domain-containing protein, partial [bacterium]
MKTKTIIIICLLISILIGCNKNPVEPDFIEKHIPWSMIDGKIAYSRTTINGDLTGYLYIINGQREKVELVKESNDYMFADLVWSHDGNKIIHSDFDLDTYNWQLYQINSDGSNHTVIYSVDAHNNYPSCSNDGRLAYWVNGFYDNHWNAYEIFIDNESFFSQSRCDQTRPAWSPDGQYLVISIWDSTSQGALYKVNVDDKSSIPLIQGSGFDSLGVSEEIFHDPIFSPDGSKIAFTKWGPDYSEIWVMDADGSNPTQLTSGYQDSYPAWSPDGSKIAFNRSWHIYIMNADGSEITQVTQEEGEYPTWIN